MHAEGTGVARGLGSRRFDVHVRPRSIGTLKSCSTRWPRAVAQGRLEPWDLPCGGRGHLGLGGDAFTDVPGRADLWLEVVEGGRVAGVVGGADVEGPPRGGREVAVGGVPPMIE